MITPAKLCYWKRHDRNRAEPLQLEGITLPEHPMEVFHHEYNDVWPVLMDALETWIEANDAELEATNETAPPEL